MPLTDSEASCLPVRDDTPCLSPRFEELASRLPPARLCELLQMFFADTSQVLCGLREALLQGEAQTVHNAAHKCKGSARLLGLQAVADAAQQAEAWAQEGLPPGPRHDVVQAFDAALAASRRALRHWLDGRGQVQPD